MVLPWAASATQTDYAKLIPGLLRHGFELKAKGDKYEVSTFDIKEIVSSSFPPSNPPVPCEEAKFKTPSLKEHGNSDRFPTTNAYSITISWRPAHPPPLAFLPQFLDTNKNQSMEGDTTLEQLNNDDDAN